MNRNYFILLIIFIFTSCNSFQPATNLNKYVDPFICTAGDHGQTDPSANVPFGMIKAGPDTDPGNHGGYNFDASRFLGFSQNRASGVGCSGTGGNLRIFPFTENEKNGAEMDKSKEIASPGYYSVALKNGIVAEATALRTSAVYRFSFPSEKNAGIRVNFRTSYSGFIDENHIFFNERFLKGWIQCKGNCGLGSYKFYYVLELEQAPERMEESDGLLDIYFKGQEKGAYLVKVGLSSVGTAEAEDNLNQEIGNKGFNEVKTEAEKLWESYLDKILVKSDNDTLKTLFYTHLYHASQTPYSIADLSGFYGGSDGKVYQSKSGNYYSGWSLWDTFRTKMPLLSVLYPGLYKEMMNSMYQLYLQGKSDNPTNTESFILIRNEHTIPVLLDAYRKNLLDEPLDAILPLMQQEAENLSMDSPDKVLEACYDWWALSEIAAETGHDDLQQEFLQKAMSYRTVWEEKFKIMGETADVMHGDGLYEGTLWQYRWFVPYDFKWIENEMGGREETIAQLDYFFGNNLFNVGNQPDIHVPFLYYELGEPSKSQKLVRDILLNPTVNPYGTHKKWDEPYIGKVFKDDPAGYIPEMDDDAGTMSAWFVLSSMGLYPRNIGETSFWILPPVFDEVSIQLSENKSFRIVNIKNSDDEIYIQKAVLNGKALNRSYLDYTEIRNGGTLELTLGKNPSTDWGKM